MYPPYELDRRTLLRGAVAVVFSAGAPSVLTACATGGGSPKSAVSTKGPVSVANPLGVDGSAPLNPVIFKGGYGDDWARYIEALYAQAYPHAPIKHEGIQQVGQTEQPRFVAGNPPDVVDNAGNALNISALIASGQVADLTPLLDAPSVDDPKTKVRDTIQAGVVDTELVAGKIYQLDYVQTVFGFCYSRKLFDARGWQYPTTWDSMLALCAQIKASGMAPWTYQGKNPDYWNEPLMAMAGKAGGPEVVLAIDNLEPGAWRAPAVLAAAQAIYQIADRGYLLEGTASMTHTQAQTEWCENKAAFIPCGTWVENEMKGIMPADFDMAISPTPSLSRVDKLPFTAIYAKASEPFIVPSQARNVAGGMEFLRLMLSKAGALNFAKTTGSISVVKGGAEGVELSPGLQSAIADLAAAGSHLVLHRWGDWYKQLNAAVKDANGALMTKAIRPEEWVDRCQKAADSVAADPGITKFKR